MNFSFLREEAISLMEEINSKLKSISRLKKGYAMEGL